MLLNDFKAWFQETNEPYLVFSATNKAGRAKKYNILCPMCESTKVVIYEEGGYLSGKCENCNVVSTEYFWRVKEIK